MIYRETDTKVREQIAAIEKLDGYPKRPEYIGLAFVAAALVPEAYRAGAIGWTSKLVEPEVAGVGELTCDIPDSVIAKYTGQAVVVDGKTVTVSIVSKTAPTQTEPKAGGSGTK